MENKRTRFLGFTALAIALSLACVVPTAQAGIITALTVDVGATNFNIWAGAAPLHIGAGIDVTGKTAVFAQNSTTAGVYNFDSSDVTNCPTPCTPVIHVTIQGVGVLNFFDNKTQTGAAGNTLHANQLDPGGNVFNESSAWVFLGELAEGNGNFLDLWVGYADSAHTDPCADNASDGGPAGNCHPDGPWTGADFFLAVAQTGGCTGAHGDPCFDSGAIRISERHVATPEPASLVLLGAGLIGLAAWGRKRFASQK